jgi:hypothetical protein
MDNRIFSLTPMVIIYIAVDEPVRVLVLVRLALMQSQCQRVEEGVADLLSTDVLGDGPG